VSDRAVSVPVPRHDRAGGNGGSREDLSVLARGGTLNLVGAVVDGVLSFALVVVVTRGLRAGGAGAFFEAVGLFTILAAVVGFGADVGLARTIPRQRALGRISDIRPTLKIALGPVLGIGAVVAALAWAYGPDLASVFARRGHTEELAALIRVFAVFIPIYAACLVALAATRGFGTMRPSVLVDKVGRPALQPLLVLAATVAGAGSLALALAWAGPFLVALGAALTWLLILLRRAERQAAADGRAPRPAGELAAEFWRFTGPRGLSGVFQLTSLWMNTLLIGALHSTEEAGVYAAATRYLVAAAVLAQAIRQVMAPKLSELLARQSQERAAAVYRTTTSWAVGLNWPIYLVLIAYGPVLLGVFGDGFQAGQPALTILAATMLVATAVGPVDVVLLMGGRSTWNLLNTVLALSVNLALGFALVPRYGLTGAAIALSAAILLNNLIPLAQVWRFMHLHPFGEAVWVAEAITAVCFGALGLALRALVGLSLPGFLLYALLGCALYAVLLWRWRERLQLPAFYRALRTRAVDLEPAP
jgi:O-antigen/teichoic acid export membrane protein